MRISWKATLLLGIATAGMASKSHAKPKYSSIVIDAKTGKKLYDFQSNRRRYPASLTKMMTLYLIFEGLESQKFNLNTRIPISQNAAMQPPSKLGLEPNNSFTLQEGILALITRSANDVATAFGEFIAGSEQQFAKIMSNKAKSLGMKNTVYKNASGLHNNKQVTTARDQAHLGRLLRTQFPKYYEYFSTRKFRYKNRIIRNHNNLLRTIPNIDGIKTGYTQESGFNIVSSYQTNDQSIIVTVMGLPSSKERDLKVLEIISYYLAQKNKDNELKQFHKNILSSTKKSHNNKTLKHPSIAKNNPYPAKNPDKTKPLPTKKKASKSIPSKNHNIPKDLSLIPIPKYSL